MPTPANSLRVPPHESVQVIIDFLFRLEADWGQEVHRVNKLNKAPIRGSDPRKPGLYPVPGIMHPHARATRRLM